MQTWSRVIDIATDQAVADVDPDTGQGIRAGAGLPEVGVDRSNGNLYVVWEDARFSNGTHNDVAFSMSTDGGLTWTAPVKINQNSSGAAAFTPSVEVADNGTLGVTFYDLRNNTSDPNTLPTNYWMIHCHAKPAVAAPPEAPVPREVAPAESLDDYFDRLDAAFGTLETEGFGVSAAEAEAVPILREPVSDVADLRGTTAAEPSSVAIHGWDPALSEEEPPVVLEAAPDQTSGAPVPAGPPSLSDAFAALLAAEQGQPLVLPRAAAATPPSEPVATPPPATGLGDAEIDTIVQQVIQRLTSSAVRDTVVEVAERLVREEIARIKSVAP